MAITVRYVSSSGSASYANSTNSATPSSLSTAITNAAAGDHFKVIADGTYTRAASDTPTGDGTATSPIVWEGVVPGTFAPAAAGRAADGTLDTSAFPTIAYNSGFRWAGNGADFNVYRGLKFTGSVSNSLVAIGVDAIVSDCSVVNSSTNAAAAGVDGASNAGTRVINCDVQAGGASGGAYAVQLLATTSVVSGCRAKCAGGNAIISRNFALHNVCYGSARGLVNDATTTAATYLQNTIYGMTGDGIDIVTSATARQTIVGNHITDCGGWGIDFNTSTCVKHLAMNRFRDNASGDVNGGGDWQTGGNWRNVTADTGGAETDYVDAANLTFALVATAPGIGGGPGSHQDIGACGPRMRGLEASGTNGGMNG